MHNQVSPVQLLQNSNSQLIIDQILNSFRYTATCKVCNQEILLNEINQLIIHQLKCQQYASNHQNILLKEQKKNSLIEEELPIQNQKTNGKRSSKKKKIIQSLLEVGKLSKGSKNLYPLSLIRLFKHLDDQ